jgi:hypothetical protein
MMNLLLKHQIINEEWLPVVDDRGTVHGKVARSVSDSAENKYLHPVVRIVLMHKGMLFLKARPLSSTEPRLLDHPFERHLRFKETLDEGVREAFIQTGETSDLPYRFIIRYVHKDDTTHRLIYLYLCNISDSLHPGEGKWWTTKQIEENLGAGLFSTYFEKEYELLNTTVLPADRLMRSV